MAVINPYGGVEALLTHATSSLYDIPSAHAPMYEDWDTWNQSAGIMDPRIAAEGISVPFFFSVLKGLRLSPRIVPVEPDAQLQSDALTVADIDCLVLPQGCLGLPVMAAIAQAIPIIFVRDEANLTNNGVDTLVDSGALNSVGRKLLRGGRHDLRTTRRDQPGDPVNASGLAD